MSGGLGAWIPWPVLVTGSVVAVVAATERGVPAVAALVGLQLAMVVVVTALERGAPEHVSWNRPRADLGTDALHLVVSGLAVSGALRALIFGVTPSIGLWPARWPFAAQLALALVLADLGSYLTHVACHRVRWLWPFHAPHHSALRLYWLNSTRMHPVDMATTILSSLLPLAVLGAPPNVLAAFDAFAISHLMLQHSNVRLRMGPLSHVVASAEFHRWHHSSVRAEGEANYASFFSLWDHLFRTFRMDRDREPPEHVGLYDGEVMPDGWVAHLLWPLRQLAAPRTGQRAPGSDAENRGSDVNPER